MTGPRITLLASLVFGLIAAGGLILATNGLKGYGDHTIAFNPCAQGWPPEPVCIPTGWRVIGPDGREYRHGVGS